MNNYEEEYDVPEEYYGTLNEAQLPRIVREFQKSASEVSHQNEIPAAVSFFTILGQLTKDFVQIPNGRNIEDSRIHFCWIQTSGTGKSTLWNFVGPVSKMTFDMINAKGTHPPLETNSQTEGVEAVMNRTFNTFGVTDYTDSVLIGGWTEKKEMEEDENGVERWTGQMTPYRKAGLLEGSGLAHWDEFEYSGIFKQSQHQEKAIVYLNTLMNTLAGESWVITKALASYDNKVMECFCERSVLAMTYPPSNLNEVIAQKGVLQRMLPYVREVPQKEQHEMRLEQLSKAGTIEEVNQPIEKYAKGLYHIYNMVQTRFMEVGADPLKTVTYDANFGQTLMLAYMEMNKQITMAEPHVADIASNFTTRLMKTLMKMSVLCCIADSPDINKDNRFIVAPHHVRQATYIVRNCYESLVEWLNHSLSGKRKSLTKQSIESHFFATYKKMEKDADNYVPKKEFFEEVGKSAKKVQSYIYRRYKYIEHRFEEDKVDYKGSKVKAIRLKKGDSFEV